MRCVWYPIEVRCVSTVRGLRKSSAAIWALVVPALRISFPRTHGPHFRVSVLPGEVQGTFLIAVGGIVRGVEVQEHLLGRSSVFGPHFKVELEDGFGYPAARAPRGRVLQARDGRLARQIGPALRQRAARHLQQGVFAQGIRIVLVLVAARYLEDPLAHQRGQGVAPPPLSLLRHALGDGLAQTQLLVRLRKPKKPAV